MKTLRSIGAITASILVWTATAQAARAEPAMWVVRDADSTIYLFGSVHALKPGLEWETPKIRAALKDATEVWFEVPDIADQDKALGELLPMMMRTGMSPERPLSSRLTPEEYAALGRRAQGMGVDVAVLNPMRPWLAAVMLSAAPLKAAGFDAAAGVERVLQREAQAQGDQVRGFETLTQQMNFFATLPETAQLEFLRSMIEGDEDRAELEGMATAWAEGDLTTLEATVIGEMRAESPDLYRAIIAGRNEAWARTIIARLEGSGVSFIAVGAGHLVGPDSLQSKLQARGVSVSRY